METAENDTGIHLIDDVLPWLGPEIAIGFIDVGGIGDNPQVVALVGTKDKEAAETVVRHFVDFLEEEQEAEFREDTYRGFVTFGDVDDEQGNFAITDSYLVFTTSEQLLKDTIDMMEESVDALSDKTEFKEARDSVREERFSFLYVDVESIIRQSRVATSAADAGEALAQVEDRLPEILGVSGSFVDNGLRVDGYYQTPSGITVIPSANPLGSAALLPDDSLALLSVTGLKETLEDALADMEGDTTLGFDIQDSLDGIEYLFGIDIEQSVLGLLAGEVAIALLPSDFSFDIVGGYLEAFHALALFEFDERADAEVALNNLVETLQGFGVPFDEVDIEGEVATLADLRAFLGDETGYTPGLMVLGDYLVLGTTDLTLRTAVRVRDGDEPSLSNEEEFSRVVDMAPDGKNSILYLNIEEMVGDALKAQSPSDRESYRENAAPFLDPLRVFLAGVSTNTGTTTFTTVITIE